MPSHLGTPIALAALLALLPLPASAQAGAPADALGGGPASGTPSAASVGESGKAPGERLSGERADLLDQLVQGVQSFYERTDSFEAAFEQRVVRKYRPGGQKATPRRGVAYFLKPGKMRWDYQSPEQVFYISDGETLWVYEPERQVAYRGEVRGSRLWDSMKFLFGAAKLREEFEVSLGDVQERQAELVLTPRGGQMDFRQLGLTVDRKSYEILQTRLVDPAGDESVITFSNPRYLPIDNPEGFDWRPGEGVRVEDLGRRGAP